MYTSTLSLLRMHFTTCTVPWGKDMHHILLSWQQYYKATARTVRAKRERHGPVRLHFCLLGAVFMYTSTLSLLRMHFTTCTVPWGKDMHHILLSWQQYYKATKATTFTSYIIHATSQDHSATRAYAYTYVHHRLLLCIYLSILTLIENNINI